MPEPEPLNYAGPPQQAARGTRWIRPCLVLLCLFAIAGGAYLFTTRSQPMNISERPDYAGRREGVVTSELGNPTCGRESTLEEAAKLSFRAHFLKSIYDVERRKVPIR